VTGVPATVNTNKWYQSEGSAILDDAGSTSAGWFTYPGAQAPALPVEAARQVPATVGGTVRQERAPARGRRRADRRAGGTGWELPSADEDELLRLGRSHARDAAGTGLVERGD
jgi:hypothetical protein